VCGTQEQEGGGSNTSRGRVFHFHSVVMWYVCLCVVLCVVSCSVLPQQRRSKNVNVNVKVVTVTRTIEQDNYIVVYFFFKVYDALIFFRA